MACVGTIGCSVGMAMVHGMRRHYWVQCRNAFGIPTAVCIPCCARCLQCPNMAHTADASNAAVHARAREFERTLVACNTPSIARRKKPSIARCGMVALGDATMFFFGLFNASDHAHWTGTRPFFCKNMHWTLACCSCRAGM